MTVLDAYAVIAYLRGEPAAAEVAELLRAGSTLATANAVEVIDQMVRVWGRPADDVEGDLAVLSAAGLPLATSDPALATVVRAAAGSVVGLADSRGRRP